MSTSIGPAFTLAPGTDLFTFADKLRQVVRPAAKQYFFQHVHDIAVIAYDLAKEYRPFMEFVESELNDSCHCKREDRPWVTNLVANLRAHLFQDTDKNLYLLIHNAPSEVREAVSGMDEVTGDYDFYDSTDTQLEYLTPEQWEARRTKWDELVPTGYPNETGMVVLLGMEPRLLRIADYVEMKDTLTTDPDRHRQARLEKNHYSRIIMANATSPEEKSRIVTAVMGSIADTSERPLSDEYPGAAEQAAKESQAIWETRRELV